ncbi:carcinine transporter-like [Schistocerca gregaria]|uniref:carcinine transporter-like n=1 Tax=Schistocerca gregaria TaxID=7010 RepID=UPI00211F01D1|nr:carcinine transporter-like [Schistocerca gregaria]
MTFTSATLSGSLCVEEHEMEENGEISTKRRNTKVAPAFEEVLDSIGSRGRFQTRLNIVFNCVGPCFNVLSINVFYLAMQTPDHWCHVPGRESANLSLEEWKNFTIPRAGNSFSKCLMYNQSDGVNWNSSEPVKCQHGWDYDDTWFSLTVPSQKNWVCDNQQSANDVLFYAQNIGVALSLLFGYIGDMYGRQLLQFLCLVAHVISRLLLVLTPDILVLFILAQSLVSAAAGPMHESALSVELQEIGITPKSHCNGIYKFMKDHILRQYVWKSNCPCCDPDVRLRGVSLSVQCFIRKCFLGDLMGLPNGVEYQNRIQECQDQGAVDIVQRILLSTLLDLSYCDHDHEHISQGVFLRTLLC